MRPGRHAAADGSFGRSAGVAAGRGLLLILVALVIGILLYNAADDEGGADLAVNGTSDTTGEAETATTLPTTTTLPERPAGSVKVLVLNGTSTSGAALKVATPLNQTAGFNTIKPEDATAAVKNAKPATTVVYYVTPDFQREAAKVATFLGLNPSTSVKPLSTPAPATNIADANVVVVVGADLAAKPPASAGATSTTAPATTSTTRP